MEPPSRYSVGIVNRSGVRMPNAFIRAAVRATLTSENAPKVRIAVLLTDDAEIRELNRTYRKVDKTTDVLSFPATPDWGGTDRGFLGDIAISVPYARQQAEKRCVELAVELSYLAIHGTLHLLGFDDETEKDRRTMLQAMNRAGIAAGLPPDPEWSSVLHAEATA